MSGKRANLWRDENGAAMLEFTAAAFTFFIILFGTLDFAQVYFKWNLATKATQLGARLAAVSEPVANNLTTLTGVGGAVLPGDPMPAFDYSCTPTNATGSAGNCTNSGTYNVAAMQTIFYGRGSVPPNCGTGLNIGMCSILGGMYDQNGLPLTPRNVTVRYQYTGLGYAGRPGGPCGYGLPVVPCGPDGLTRLGGAVPTITVSLTGVSHNFTLVGGLAGITSVALPTFATTVTGEDLAGS